MTLSSAIYELLGIPLEQQPADFYRLLGLSRFERNSEVIANAASRQMLFVRQLAAGPYGTVAQELLDLLADAKSCLLDQHRRDAYDLELRQQMTPAPITPLGAPLGEAGCEDQAPAALSVFADCGDPPVTGPDTAGFADLLDSLDAVDLEAAEYETDRILPPSGEGIDSGLSVTSAFGPNPGRRVMAPFGKPLDAADFDPSLTQRQWVIGADSRCDVVVRCPYVSRRHCRVSEAAGRYWVEDLGSRNGTHVNGQVVRGKIPVTGEDLITLGTLARMPWPPDAAGKEGESHEVRILRIGRSATNDITLSHASVSRRHAQLTILADEILLEDLGSTNGTFVGDSSLRINRCRVQESDLVRIGKFRLAVGHLLQKESVA